MRDLSHRVVYANKWCLSDSDGSQMGKERLIVMVSGDPILALPQPDLSSSEPALKQLGSNSAADAPLGMCQAFCCQTRLPETQFCHPCHIMSSRFIQFTTHNMIKGAVRTSIFSHTNHLEFH